MVILKSNKEELHRVFPLLASPAYLLEYTIDVNNGLFVEDVAFWFYVDTCEVNNSNDLLHTHARLWGVVSLHPLFSAYPLLGAYLLTTYTYKRMRLLI